MANGEDYWQTGRTAGKLGLAGMTLKQMVRYSVTGKLDMSLV
jgi:hypothetical protein